MERKDYRYLGEHKAAGWKGDGWIIMPPKTIQFWSLNLSHLPVPVPGLYTAAQPQERVCVSPPEVPSGLNHSVILWYTFLLQSSAVCVGKLLHAFQSFLLAVGFPLLCFWMALKNHKNFLSCSVSSLWPQNETNQNEKQPDQKQI